MTFPAQNTHFFAKKLLNIKLNEITTYFRVYSVELLKQLPYDELNAQGYSLGVKLVWLMKKLNANLKIKFEKNKPNGTPRKKLDLSVAKNYGWNSKYNLNKGFDLTYKDYLKKIDIKK